MKKINLFQPKLKRNIKEYKNGPKSSDQKENKWHHVKSRRVIQQCIKENLPSCKNLIQKEVISDSLFQITQV
jgi:hypothetical protein